MSATKILWGQLIVVGLIVLTFVWAATQWTAWRLGYQPQLGAPWFELWRGMPVYAPPAFFWWWFHFDAYAPPVLVEGAYIASAGGFASIAVPCGTRRLPRPRAVGGKRPGAWRTERYRVPSGLKACSARPVVLRLYSRFNLAFRLLEWSRPRERRQP